MIYSIIKFILKDRNIRIYSLEETKESQHETKLRDSSREPKDI